MMNDNPHLPIDILNQIALVSNASYKAMSEAIPELARMYIGGVRRNAITSGENKLDYFTCEKYGRSDGCETYERYKKNGKYHRSNGLPANIVITKIKCYAEGDEHISPYFRLPTIYPIKYSYWWWVDGKKRTDAPFKIEQSKHKICDTIYMIYTFSWCITGTILTFNSLTRRIGLGVLHVEYEEFVQSSAWILNYVKMEEDSDIILNGDRGLTNESLRVTYDIGKMLSNSMQNINEGK